VHRGRGEFKCSGCGNRTSVTAGTIFDRTRTPLTVWFAAVWRFSSAKAGASTLAIQRDLGIRSYQTAWALLHRLRQVVVRPGRDRLHGQVEVDEAYFGGVQTGQRGTTRGLKPLVAIAVERAQPHSFGRCRMALIADRTPTSLGRFLRENVEEGSTLYTDGWRSYIQVAGTDYVLVQRTAPGAQATVVLPGVHRVISLAKRWILGTYQGSVARTHLPFYLNEFVFRFNRRTSCSRGLGSYRVLELAVDHDPVRYRQLLTHRPHTKQPPPPPGPVRSRTASLDLPSSGRPWRAA
jgi:transposase-like protein